MKVLFNILTILVQIIIFALIYSIYTLEIMPSELRLLLILILVALELLGIMIYIWSKKEIERKCFETI